MTRHRFPQRLRSYLKWNLCRRYLFIHGRTFYILLGMYVPRRHRKGWRPTDDGRYRMDSVSVCRGCGCIVRMEKLTFGQFDAREPLGRKMWTYGHPVVRRGYSVSSVRSGQWAIQHEQRTAQWVYFYTFHFFFFRFLSYTHVYIICDIYEVYFVELWELKSQSFCNFYNGVIFIFASGRSSDAYMIPFY